MYKKLFLITIFAFTNSLVFAGIEDVVAHTSEGVKVRTGRGRTISDSERLGQQVQVNH